MKRIITVCTIILCGFLLSAQSVLLPYQNPNLPVEQRVADLLSRMTLEEKVAQMNMKSLNELKLDDKGKVS